MSIARIFGVCGFTFFLMGQGITQHQHLPQHMELHEKFYSKLKVPGTDTSCCSDKDCRPVDYRVRSDGAYEFKVAGYWIKVDNKRIVRELTPDGGSHWCGMRHLAPGFGKKGNIFTYCGIVPEELF